MRRQGSQQKKDTIQDNDQVRSEDDGQVITGYQVSVCGWKQKRPRQNIKQIGCPVSNKNAFLLNSVALCAEVIEFLNYLHCNHIVI